MPTRKKPARTTAEADRISNPEIIYLDWNEREGIYLTVPKGKATAFSVIVGEKKGTVLDGEQNTFNVTVDAKRFTPAEEMANAESIFTNKLKFDEDGRRTVEEIIHRARVIESAYHAFAIEAFGLSEPYREHRISSGQDMSLAIFYTKLSQKFGAVKSILESTDKRHPEELNPLIEEAFKSVEVKIPGEIKAKSWRERQTEQYTPSHGGGRGRK